MCCGMIVCRFQLADGNQGDGGLCVIPGSHKANLLCPDDVLICQRNREPGYNIACKAGAMVILTRRRSTEPSLGAPATKGVGCYMDTRPTICTSTAASRKRACPAGYSS